MPIPSDPQCRPIGRMVHGLPRAELQHSVPEVGILYYHIKKKYSNKQWCNDAWYFSHKITLLCAGGFSNKNMKMLTPVQVPENSPFPLPGQPSSFEHPPMASTLVKTSVNFKSMCRKFKTVKSMKDIGHINNFCFQVPERLWALPENGEWPGASQ